MIIFFMFVILVAAVIVLFNLFAPHRLPWYRPHLVLHPIESASLDVSPVSRKPFIMDGLLGSEVDLDLSLEEKMVRIENILIEKNTALDKLQKQLTAEQAHRLEFDKVKELLETEIQNLRKLNKELKQRTGEMV